MNVLARTTAVLVLFGSLDAAAATKTYQVTGPVLAVDDQSITVQKGSEKWELARDASTKITGDAKVGAKVTVEYRMIATSIEAKGAPAADKTAAKKK
jgi:hypothetical protein